MRANATCMDHSLLMALDLAKRVWIRPAKTTLLPDRDLEFPYFCNNVYVIRADLYSRVIKDERLTEGPGADEVMLNKILSENNLPVCHLGNSFGIHPAYGTHGDRKSMEGIATDIIEDFTDKMLPWRKLFPGEAGGVSDFLQDQIRGIFLK